MNLFLLPPSIHHTLVPRRFWSGLDPDFITLSLWSWQIPVSCRNRKRMRTRNRPWYKTTTVWLSMLYNQQELIFSTLKRLRNGLVCIFILTHAPPNAHSLRPFVLLVHWCSIWFGCMSISFAFGYLVLAFSQHSGSTKTVIFLGSNIFTVVSNQKSEKKEEKPEHNQWDDKTWK